MITPPTAVADSAVRDQWYATAVLAQDRSLLLSAVDHYSRPALVHAHRHGADCNDDCAVIIPAGHVRLVARYTELALRFAPSPEGA